MGTVRVLSTLLILFGAGVEAPDCANTCSDPVATGRWIVGLSLIVFILPLLAAPSARRFLGAFLVSLTLLRREASRRLSLFSRLVG